MIAWLGLGLQGAALAGAAAGMITLASRGLVAATRGLAPHRRADVALVAAVLPSAVGAVVLVAVGLPSLLHSTGLRDDHCPAHDHHLHLCAVHADGVDTRLVAIGAIVAAVLAFRGISVLLDSIRTGIAVRRLEALSRDPAAPVVQVPGSPRLCHALGVLRPRILVSASLREALPPEAYAAALSHEREHLRRRDPLSTLVVSAASAIPGTGAAVAAWRAASEEACDAAAAAEHGGITVADALIRFTRLHREVDLALPGFGAAALEDRVNRLLDDEPAPGPSYAGPLLLVLGALAAFAAGFGAEPIHHAVETALQAF